MSVARPALLALGALLLGGCATVGARGPPDLSRYELQARLAARASSLVGTKSEFRVGSERFAPDCSGFVEAVYEAEGIPLRGLMRRTAPGERSGVEAAYRTAAAYGTLLGRDAWPAPGDLVFWHDTWDRNGNGRADDGLTHVGVVLWVEDGTVVFIHRGAKAVARGAMDTRRPDEAAAGGKVVNSPIRKREKRGDGIPVLAGALFAAYGRLEPGRLPAPGR